MLKNLKELRIANNISQQQLADVIGVSQQSVNKYENHNVEPDTATMIRMADFFCVSVDYLVGRTDTPDGQLTVSLTQEEQRLILRYRHITEKEKRIIKTVLDVV